MIKKIILIILVTFSLFSCGNNQNIKESPADKVEEKGLGELGSEHSGEVIGGFSN